MELTTWDHKNMPWDGCDESAKMKRQTILLHYYYTGTVFFLVWCVFHNISYFGTAPAVSRYTVVVKN
jgi:hypothetical protein